MIKGFKSSIGWNLGKKNKSSHRFEPLTSTPIIGTNNKKIKHVKNKKIETLNKCFCSSAEKNTTKKNPINI
jgi:hypothetical protein|tara:strand:+ start:376 stop:588 length:213 start_codon:yes stop_codon:yes gene_type:complete